MPDPVVQGEAYPLVAARTEYQPRRHGFPIYATEVLPVPVHWNLIRGDIAHKPDHTSPRYSISPALHQSLHRPAGFAH